jgi:hypothetical protein
MKAGDIAIVSAILLPACVLHRAEESATERFRFDVSGRAGIEVEIDRGSIEIRGVTGDEVAVVVTKLARAVSEEAAAASLERLRVRADQEGDTVRVRVTREGRWEQSHGTLRSDVEIRVPRSSDLRLATVDGRIEIRDVKGEVEAETADGRIRLKDVEGTVRVQTADGSIVGERLGGNFDVRSTDGRIKLAGAFEALRAVSSDGSITVECVEPIPLTHDWMLRTSDGSITVRLPSDFSAELDASTSDGHIENDLHVANAKVTSSRLSGTLGGGGKLVLIKTFDGRVRLSNR